jgi:hypothetical protein
MQFHLIVLNVFAVFAIAGSVCCWISAAIAVHHRKMRSANFVPALAGLVAAIKFGAAGSDGFEWFPAFLGLVGGFFVASMVISYLYGWMRASAFDEDEVRIGSGRFGPVMYLWTGCILFVGVVMLVNQAATGTYSPVHVMGF